MTKSTERSSIDSTELRSIIGENIRKLREEKKISQQKLAVAVGRTQQAVDSWERGLSSPNAEIIKKLIDYFEISADCLLGNKANKVRSEAPSLARSSAIVDTEQSSIVGTEQSSIVDENENYPDIKLIARAGKKLSPEQAEQLRKYAQFMYPEAFDDN